MQGAWPRRAKQAAVRALGSVAASFRLAVDQNRKEERLFAVWTPHRITLPSNEEGRDDPGQAVWLPRRIARLSDSTTSMLSILKVWLPRWISRWTSRRERSRRPDAESGVQTG